MTWSDAREALRARGVLGSTGAQTPEHMPPGPITGISCDSRLVQPGHVFVALKGQHADGLSFVSQALERGAAGVVAQGPRPPDLDVAWASVEDARLALALLAAEFSGDRKSVV